nr:MAG TPA: hypothetical protein [Crassvirales sp.]
MSLCVFKRLFFEFIFNLFLIKIIHEVYCLTSVKGSDTESSSAEILM